MLSAVRTQSPALHLLVCVLTAFALLASDAGATDPTAPQVTATPGLFPAFSASVPDYVVRCEPANTVRVTVPAPSGTPAWVEGAPPLGGTFSQSVPLTAG